jgi:peroxiredoxin
MKKRCQVGSVIENFDYETPWDGEKNFYAVSGGRKKILFFLRYYGCDLTQLEFRRIAADCGKYRGKGADIYAATQSSPEILRSRLKKEEIPFEIFCDPDGSLYRLFDIGYLHVGFFMRGLKGTPPKPPRYDERLEARLAEARALGITHGLYEGCEQQLPAVFVADEDQKLLLAHYSEDLVDIPDADTLLSYL